MTTKARQPALLIAGVVVVVACAVRLALVRTGRFCGDESDFWSIARAIAMGEAHPLLGPAVTGGAAKHPGPAFYYIMALPELLSKTPEADNAFVALLGGLSVGLYWDALRRSFGDYPALLAAALMACAPWSALFQDRIWNANLLCVFVVYGFWAAARLRERKASWLVVPFLAFCILFPQIHMPGPVAVVALWVLAWPALRSAKWYQLALGVALGLFLYTPFFVNELRTNWGNTRAFLSETGSARTFGFTLVPLYVFRMLTTDTSYQMLAGYWGGLDEGAALKYQIFGNADLPMAPLRLVLFLVTVAFAILSLVWGAEAVIARWKSKERPRLLGTFHGAAIVGFITNFLLLAVTGKAIFGHYVSSLLPFYFVVFAAVGKRLETSSPRTRQVVLGLAGLTLIAFADDTLHVSRTVDARNGLSTQRAVLEQMYADLSPGERSVGLSSSFRVDMSGYERLSRIVYERPLWFTDRARLTYRLRLAQPGNVGVASGTQVLDLGPIVLYRMSK